MNERGGLTLTNLVTNNKHLISNASWTSGLLDAGGDGWYITKPYDTRFNNIGDFTVILKASIDQDLYDANVAGDFFLAQSGNPLVYIGFGPTPIGGGATSRMYWVERDDSGGGLSSTIANTRMTVNSLNVFSVVKNRAAGIVQFYYNGMPDGSGTGKITSIIHAPSSSNMFGSALIRTLRGKFEYIYIYDRALTAQQIQQLYREPYCFIEYKPWTIWGALTGGVVAAARRIFNFD
jgi:hypothetical protein